METTALQRGPERFPLQERSPEWEEVARSAESRSPSWEEVASKRWKSLTIPFYDIFDLPEMSSKNDMRA